MGTPPKKKILKNNNVTPISIQESLQSKNYAPSNIEHESGQPSVQNNQVNIDSDL